MRKEHLSFMIRLLLIIFGLGTAANGLVFLVLNFQGNAWLFSLQVGGGMLALGLFFQLVFKYIPER